MRIAGGLVDGVWDDAVAALAVRGEHAVVSGEDGRGGVGRGRRGGR